MLVASTWVRIQCLRAEPKARSAPAVSRRKKPDEFLAKRSSDFPPTTSQTTCRAALPRHALAAIPIVRPNARVDEGIGRVKLLRDGRPRQLARHLAPPGVELWSAQLARRVGRVLCGRTHIRLGDPP